MSGAERTEGPANVHRNHHSHRLPGYAIVARTGAAILRGAAAAADSNQGDQFLALLSQEGVPAASGVPALVKTAHEVCADLAGGMSTNGVMDALVDYANAVTPGADPGRLRRTETRLAIAAVRSYRPGNQLSVTKPARSNGTRRVVLASFTDGDNPAVPPPALPADPDAKPLIPPQAVASPPTPKAAPRIVGPPLGGVGGGGGRGGGSRRGDDHTTRGTGHHHARTVRRNRAGVASGSLPRGRLARRRSAAHIGL